MWSCLLAERANERGLSSALLQRFPLVFVRAISRLLLSEIVNFLRNYVSNALLARSASYTVASSVRS